MSKSQHLSKAKSANTWKQYLPCSDWLFHYRKRDWPGDAIAGVIVAVMLIPQGMAYALLAGLPPAVGLYASILPLILYAALGTSRALAVGPVAIVSLLVATGVGELAQPNTPEYLALALVLALMVGVIQLLMGLLRLGFIVNFLSHAVIVGFTNAAALIIGMSQFKHLLGVELPKTHSFLELVGAIAHNLAQTNFVTLALGLGSVLTLLYFKHGLGKWLRQRQILGRPCPESWVLPLTRTGPLLIVVVSILLVAGLGLNNWANVKIVGDIPTGLPPLTMPAFDWPTWQSLGPTALTISFVGFMESIAVAKSLASKRRQKIDADQELIALGAANLGAAFTGGYPVTGGFSRSGVNFAAGANTGLASIITALLIALTVLLLTPLFYFLPQTVLAAVILVAVAGLIDGATFGQMWCYNKADAISLGVTFFAVLLVGIETGIALGVITSLALYLWRTSRPHMAVVGRIPGTEHFRNVRRHRVITQPHILTIRVDESLYFANTKYLEDHLQLLIAEKPELESLVLVCSAVNFIDASALESLERFGEDLKEAGVELYLAEVKGPVMDQLERGGFMERLGRDRVFLTPHDAMLALTDAQF